MSDPENGFYIKSPKSFLGANTSDAQQAVFSTVVEKMLAFIKQETEHVKGIELQQVVIGRPVNFHGLQGNDGIEMDLVVPISQIELAEAIKDELRQFELLINESLLQAGTQPDTIFVTGGTAISPVIQTWINSIFPDVEVVIGNHFGSVTSGLVTHAQRLFEE